MLDYLSRSETKKNLTVNSTKFEKLNHLNSQSDERKQFVGEAVAESDSTDTELTSIETNIRRRTREQNLNLKYFTEFSRHYV